MKVTKNLFQHKLVTPGHVYSKVLLQKVIEYIICPVVSTEIFLALTVLPKQMDSVLVFPKTYCERNNCVFSQNCLQGK